MSRDFDERAFCVCEARVRARAFGQYAMCKESLSSRIRLVLHRFSLGNNDDVDVPDMKSARARASARVNDVSSSPYHARDRTRLPRRLFLFLFLFLPLILREKPPRAPGSHFAPNAHSIRARMTESPEIKRSRGESTYASAASPTGLRST